MIMPAPRDFLTTPGACAAGAAAWPERPGAATGLGVSRSAAGLVRGVQLRANALARLRPATEGPADARPGRFGESGGGRVDLPGAVGALGEVGYSGWVIPELDAVLNLTL